MCPNWRIGLPRLKPVSVGQRILCTPLKTCNSNFNSLVPNRMIWRNVCVAVIFAYLGFQKRQKRLIRRNSLKTLSPPHMAEKHFQLCSRWSGPTVSPPPGTPPHTFIAKILQTSRTGTKLYVSLESGETFLFGNIHLAVFPDFSNEVQRQQSWFQEVKRRMRVQHLKYAMLFPARLSGRWWLSAVLLMTQVPLPCGWIRGLILRRTYLCSRPCEYI